MYRLPHPLWEKLVKCGKMLKPPKRWAAFEAGITTIDTAEVYGGSPEQIVVALSDVRDEAVYATKVFANHLQYDQVIEACDRSLKPENRLYRFTSLVGAFNSKIVLIEETMSALIELKQQGKIRQWCF